MTLAEQQNSKIISLLESVLSELKEIKKYSVSTSEQILKESKTRKKLGKKLLTENLVDELVKKTLKG